ncbi:MAG: hypothetical protein IPJ78_17315 [Gemmatimonadetes bacterium]|nr:hypothetical protein [Gemmatimonadota bacterium]
MDPSFIPTDSLYKFVSMSGVVLVCVSLWAVLKLRAIVWARLFDAERKLGVVDVELSFLRPKKGSAAAEVSVAPAPSVPREEVKRVLLLHEENRVLHREIRHQVRELIVLSVIALFTTGTGFGMAYWGFTNWYSKIQVHSDKLLAADSLPGVEQKP